MILLVFDQAVVDRAKESSQCQGLFSPKFIDVQNESGFTSGT
jgi:hypothetical protein